MPFFVVPIEWGELADGTISGYAASEASAEVEHPTREAAEAAAAATAPIRAVRREAWSRAYGQPFPGEDHRVVEALTTRFALIYVMQVLNGSPQPIDPLVGPQGVSLPFTATLIEYSEAEIVDAMPTEIRAARDRSRAILPPGSPPSDASVEAWEAFYRQQRAWQRHRREHQDDFEVVASWVREHVRRPPVVWHEISPGEPAPDVGAHVGVPADIRALLETGVERLSQRSRRVLALAQAEARRRNHEEVGVEYLLLGLIHVGIEQGGGAALVLGNLGVDPYNLRRMVPLIRWPGPEPSPGDIEFSPPARAAVEHAVREADSFGSDDVGTEHLLLGILSISDDIATVVLKAYGVNLAKVKAELERHSEPNLP